MNKEIDKKQNINYESQNSEIEQQYKYRTKYLDFKINTKKNIKNKNSISPNMRNNSKFNLYKSPKSPKQLNFQKQYKNSRFKTKPNTPKLQHDQSIFRFIDQNEIKEPQIQQNFSNQSLISLDNKYINHQPSNNSSQNSFDQYNNQYHSLEYENQIINKTNQLDYDIHNKQTYQSKNKINLIDQYDKDFNIQDQSIKDSHHKNPNNNQNVNTNLYKDSQDMFMTFPCKEEFMKQIEKQLKSRDLLRKFIFKYFKNSNLIVQQLLINKDKQKTINFDSKLKEIFSQKKFNIMEKIPLNLMKYFNQIMNIITDSNKPFDKEYISNNFQEIFIKLNIEILNHICSIDTQTTKLLNPDENQGVQYLIKLRITSESLLQCASKLKSKLNLKYQKFYLENVKIQFEYLRLLENNKTELSKESKLFDIINDTQDLNLVANQTVDILLANPVLNFIETQPHPTPMDVNSRINPFLASSLQMEYPFNNDPSIRQIKFKLAKFLDDKFDNELGRQMIIEEDMVNDIAYMTNLYQMSFGICTDSPAINRIFPQELKIDMCADMLRSVINIDMIKQKGLVNCQGGIHHENDRNILKRYICNISLGNIIKNISDKDLILVKYQWGCEIASYFMFVDQLTVQMFNYAMVSIILEIFLQFQQESNILSAVLRGSFGIALNIFAVFFIERQKVREDLYRELWKGDRKTRKTNSKILTTFKNNIIFDILNNVQVYDEFNHINKWRQLSNILILAMFLCMVVIVIKCLERKFTAQTQNDNYMSLFWGIMVTVTIKIFYTLNEQLGKILIINENQKYHQQMVNVLSLRNYIFNQFNLFFNLFYLAFIKKQIFGLPCIETTMFINKTFTYESCTAELTDQLTINIVFYLTLNFLEIGIPFLINQYQINVKNNSKQRKDDCLNDFNLNDMEHIEEDQLEIIIQLTMILTFGVAMPISFLMIYISFMLEIRVDLQKQIHFYKRGECRSDMGIGVWVGIIEAGGMISVGVNIMIVLFEMYQIHLGYERGSEVDANTDQFHDWQLFTSFVISYQLFLFMKQMAIIQLKDSNQYDHIFKLNDKIRSDVRKSYFNSITDDGIENDDNLLSLEFLEKKSGTNVQEENYF